MKKLSIKLKITLWFTIFMILVSAVVFAFITYVSDTTSAYQLRGTLSELIDENTWGLDYEDGELEFGDDFVSFKSGIYCLTFYEDGQKISGYAPYSELEGGLFEDQTIRTVTIAGETYLIYDRLVKFKRHQDVWIRGVVSESKVTMTSSIYKAALIALPLLILLASVGGYFIAGHSLRKIKEISQTAQNIGRSGDLSKRIEVENNGDELNQLAGTFNRMFERLETNFEAERSFTADASHELRTPVTTILAQCEYAFENVSNEQELYEVLGAIQKQGYKMSHLIESLLSFTRIEQRTETLEYEMIDLSHIVQNVCLDQKITDEKNITLSEEIEPDIKIKANMALMMRMLENLIRNAYRYGKENGHINVGLKKIAHEINLTVADDGIGIDAGELPNIWNRFYRVDKSRSYGKSAGLGLGLAMVKQIAELHGGTVEAESELGFGSVFTIRFPGK